MIDKGYTGVETDLWAVIPTKKPLMDGYQLINGYKVKIYGAIKLIDKSDLGKLCKFDLVNSKWRSAETKYI